MELDVTGRKLVTGGTDGSVQLWNFSSGQRLKHVSTAIAPSTEVSGVVHVYLAKVSYYVSVGWSRDIWMWPDQRHVEKHHVRKLQGHSEDILCVAFCPPNLVCSGAYDGTILVHNCESCAVHRRVQILSEPSEADDAEESSTLNPEALLRSVAIECMPSSPMALPEMSTSTSLAPREKRDATDLAPSARSLLGGGAASWGR